MVAEQDGTSHHNKRSRKRGLGTGGRRSLVERMDCPPVPSNQPHWRGPPPKVDSSTRTRADALSETASPACVPGVTLHLCWYHHVADPSEQGTAPARNPRHGPTRADTHGPTRVTCLGRGDVCAVSTRDEPARRIPRRARANPSGRLGAAPPRIRLGTVTCPTPALPITLA